MAFKNEKQTHNKKDKEVVFTDMHDGVDGGRIETHKLGEKKVEYGFGVGFETNEKWIEAILVSASDAKSLARFLRSNYGTMGEVLNLFKVKERANRAWHTDCSIKDFGSAADFVLWSSNHPNLLTGDVTCFLFKESEWLCFEQSKNKFTTILEFLTRDFITLDPNTHTSSREALNNRLSLDAIIGKEKETQAESNCEKEDPEKQSREAQEKVSKAVALLKEAADSSNPLAELLYGIYMVNTGFSKGSGINSLGDALKYLFKASMRPDTSRIGASILNIVWSMLTTIIGRECIKNLYPNNQNKDSGTYSNGSTTIHY